jgi:hypothetical protein
VALARRDSISPVAWIRSHLPLTTALPLLSLMINLSVPDAGTTLVLIGLVLAGLVPALRLPLGQLVRRSKKKSTRRPDSNEPG